MKKSDLHKLIKESMPGYPEDRFASTAGDTKWPERAKNPDPEEETSGDETVHVPADVSGDTGWAPQIKTEGKKKKGGKMSDGQYSRLSDKLGLQVQDIETKMKAVLKDWKAAEGDAKKPFVEKLKELTADKKDKEKEMDELDAKFDAQAPPEMEVDKSAMDEGASDGFPNLNKWWTEDPKKVITFIYWLRKQTPPAAADRDKIWKTMAKFLNKKHPAPEEVYKKIISEGFSDEDRRSKETVELDHRDTSYMSEYNSAINNAFHKLGRAESKYFSEGDYEVEIKLIPTHAHRGFPDSFIYRPRRSPGFIGYMETILFNRVNGDTYTAIGTRRDEREMDWKFRDAAVKRRVEELNSKYGYGSGNKGFSGGQFPIDEFIYKPSSDTTTHPISLTIGGGKDSLIYIIGKGWDMSPELRSNWYNLLDGDDKALIDDIEKDIQQVPMDKSILDESLLKEELTRIDKSDIKKLIQKEIETSLKSRNFKDKVSDAVTKDVKKNPELEKMVVEITRNVITQLYKVLWMRRTFWRNSLKNTPA